MARYGKWHYGLSSRRQSQLGLPISYTPIEDTREGPEQVRARLLKSPKFKKADGTPDERKIEWFIDKLKKEGKVRSNPDPKRDRQYRRLARIQWKKILDSLFSGGDFAEPFNFSLEAGQIIITQPGQDIPSYRILLRLKEAAVDAGSFSPNWKNGGPTIILNTQDNSTLVEDYNIYGFVTGFGIGRALLKKGPGGDPLRDTFVHEFIHLMDYLRAPQSFQQASRKASQKSLADNYINLPAEMNAWYQAWAQNTERVLFIRMKRVKDKKQWLKKQLQTDFSPEKLMISLRTHFRGFWKDLSETNVRKLRRRVGTFWQEWMERLR